MTPEDIVRQAHDEIAAEDHRVAVDRMKVVIRERSSRPLWRRLFPSNKETMKTITAIYDFFFNRSTDQIVSNPGRMVRKLDKHEAKQFARRQRKMVKAARLTARSEAHRVEAEKAANVRKKIADLIG